MSDFEIDFSCIDKLQKKVSEMGKKSNKLTNKALNAGADVILDEMVKRCPVRTGKAKKNLKKSKVKSKKGEKYINIGINKEDNSEAFYLKFYEWGTSRGQIARPFMRPTFENKKAEALKETVKVMKEGLND